MISGEQEQSIERITKVEKIMSTNIISLDVSKTAAHAADLMTEKKVGSIIITKNSLPFGLITERDLVRRYHRDTVLENLASYPLITADRTTTVENAVEIMLKNGVRKLPIIDQNGSIAGIITVSDLAMFLLSRRKPSFILSILRAVSRGKAPKCDACNGEKEIQWCDTCNRFMCLACEDEIHTVDLP
jgi:CBS domain-containing protein